MNSKPQRKKMQTELNDCSHPLCCLGQTTYMGSSVRPFSLGISLGKSFRHLNFMIFWRKASPFVCFQSLLLSRCTLKDTTKMSLHIFGSLLRGHQCGFQLMKPFSSFTHLVNETLVSSGPILTLPCSGYFSQISLCTFSRPARISRSSSSR